MKYYINYEEVSFQYFAISLQRLGSYTTEQLRTALHFLQDTEVSLIHSGFTFQCKA